MADESLPRETAVEKSTECPTCGTEVPAVETSYGSVVPGACPKCNDEGDQLDAQKAAAGGEAPEAAATPAAAAVPPGIPTAGEVASDEE